MNISRIVGETKLINSYQNLYLVLAVSNTITALMYLLINFGVFNFYAGALINVCLLIFLFLIVTKDYFSKKEVQKQ